MIRRESGRTDKAAGEGGVQGVFDEPALIGVEGDTMPSSSDWDEVNDFCRRVYMPYRVSTLGQMLTPKATLQLDEVGQIKVTRFAYGVPVRLDQFDPDAGNILVLTTLRGALRHKQTDTTEAETSGGSSFVVDCSRTDYWLKADEAHQQLNLTIPHDMMAAVAHRWLGFWPDDRLWTRRVGFGGVGTRWYALLGYLLKSLKHGAMPPDAPMTRHLQETLCLDLLYNWADAAGISLKDGARHAAPRYVREAEAMLEADARDAPTIGEVAQRVGVSARTLSEGFRQFRGIGPRDFLANRRLEGLRAALQAAGPGDSVTGIASTWGYVNFGAMAGRYRSRFGELPSATLARAIAGG